MKALYFKTTLPLVLMIAAGISAGAQSLKKDSHREFTTTSSTELKIDNQFGNITVTDWDQNKVVIDVNIEVTGSDESKAQKLLDKITVEFKEEGSLITAKTVIGENGKSNLKNETGKKQSFKIDYTVKLPKSVKISLDNQFGDMIVGSLTGSFSADLQFGSLNAVSLTGPETKIDAQFGKVTIGAMKDGTFDVQHCDAMKISDGGNLVIDAQFTKIEIGTVTSLKADLNHSDAEVESLTDLLKLDANLGSMKIGNISAGFKSIDVEQNMGDLTISIDPKAGYTLNAEVNMGSLKVPDGLKLTREKEHDVPGVTAEKVSGIIGNGNSTVTVNSNMGSVKIR